MLVVVLGLWASSARAATGSQAYVVNFSVNSVSPVDLSTGATGTGIGTGNQPKGVAITPDGATAYWSSGSPATARRCRRRRGGSSRPPDR